MVLAGASSGAASESGWLSAFKDAGISAPDPNGVSFGGQDVIFVWRDHFVGACSGPLTPAAREAAEAKGWTLFELPESPAEGVPAGMISIFRD